MAKDAPKMKGFRSRDQGGGTLRRKRSDTKISTLRKKYGRAFAGHSGWQLGTLLRTWRIPSLKRALKRRTTRTKAKKRK